MQQHVSKYFARRPSPAIAPTPGMRPVGQDSTFSEHGHVAYQIKENHECSNKVPNILPADSLSPPPPQTLGMGSVGQNSTFSEHSLVAYQIIKRESRMQQHGIIF